MINIIFSGGGSGGHFYPLIAVARELKEQNKDIKIYFTAPKNPDKGALKKEGIIFKSIVSGKLRRYFSFKNFISPFLILTGFAQSIILFNKVSPKAVFLKGGYGALPTGLAALVLRVPIFIHESDSVPGLMNKIFHKFSKVSFVAFREAFPVSSRVKVVGNPVRDMSSKLTRDGAKKELGIATDKPIIFVSGGSQGAGEINELIFNLIGDLKDEFFTLHIIGKSKMEEYEKRLEEKGTIDDYKIYPYLYEKQLKAAYRAADLLVFRAGAGMIFEAARNAKPSILIPLMSSAGEHQLRNAYSYSASGAGLIMEEPNKNIHTFLALLRKTIGDKNKLKAMSEAAQKFAKPDSAKEIASTLNEYLI